MEYRQSHWAQIIQDRNASGLTIKAYCESEGIHVNSYYYWLKKLREAAGEELAITAGSANSLTLPVFAEVKLPDQQPRLPVARCENQHQICVETAGLRITAGGEYPIDKLAALLKAVVQPCC